MNSSLLSAIHAVLGACSPDELEQKLNEIRDEHAPETASESMAVVQAVAALVREKLALARELGELARVDALTGLPNARAFDERLNLELRRSARSRKSFALVLIDLADCATGADPALRMLSTTIARHVRYVDFAARISERQFAMLLVDVDRTSAQAIVARLVEAIDEAKIHACVGTATSFPVDTAQTLTERADAALHDARLGS